MIRWLVIVLALAGPAAAVEPGEILADPALEARARALSQGLRCLVCRNENIDDSDAELARDLRLLVRERLVEGDTDGQAMNYIVARYGEYVLLRPDAGGVNLILWLAGPVLLLAGIGMALPLLRHRREEDELSVEDRARLAKIMADET